MWQYELQCLDPMGQHSIKGAGLKRLPTCQAANPALAGQRAAGVHINMDTAPSYSELCGWTCAHLPGSLRGLAVQEPEDC